MLNKTASVIRVSSGRLILGLGIVAVLSPVLTHAAASARPEPRVAPAVSTVAVPAKLSTATSRAVSPFDTASWDGVPTGTVDPKVFAMALQAADAALERDDVKQPTTLTVIDFSRPSTVERMWVFDL